MNKSILRQKFRGICSQISSLYQQEAAQAAAHLLVTLPFFKQSEHIACYLFTKNEFDASPLIEAVWQAQKKCYVPVLSKEEKSLDFVAYRYGDVLHLNRYAILEPVHTQQKIMPALLDIVITPLIAFDRYGHRLGTGGGYYDRTFAFLQTKQSKKVQLIGLGYAAQEADQLPSDPWDIHLDGVITEQAFIDFLQPT